MYYVRAGLPIQELAFLRRWKSNVVLQYAEEALQEKAISVPGLHAQEEVRVDDVVKDQAPPQQQQQPGVAAPSTPAFTDYSSSCRSTRPRPTPFSTVTP